MTEISIDITNELVKVKELPDDEWEITIKTTAKENGMPLADELATLSLSGINDFDAKRTETDGTVVFTFNVEGAGKCKRAKHHRVQPFVKIKGVKKGFDRGVNLHEYNKPPEPPATKPEPPATKPEPPATKPEPPATKPEPPATKPEPPATKPEPPATKPEPPATKPQAPAAATLRPSTYPRKDGDNMADQNQQQQQRRGKQPSAVIRCHQSVPIKIGDPAAGNEMWEITLRLKATKGNEILDGETIEVYDKTTQTKVFSDTTDADGVVIYTPRFQIKDSGKKFNYTVSLTGPLAATEASIEIPLPETQAVKKTVTISNEESCPRCGAANYKGRCITCGFPYEGI